MSNSVLSFILLASSFLSTSSKYFILSSRSVSILFIADEILDFEVTKISAGKILIDSKLSILLSDIGSMDSILSISSPKKLIL